MSFSVHESLTVTASTSTSPLSLHDALPIFDRLAALPGDTLVCCGHEYTLANAAFAAAADADNPALHARRAEAASQRERRRSEEHTSELQSRENLVCRLLLEKKKYKQLKA